MVWNEKLKREIPDGWSVAKVLELAKTHSGGTPTSTKAEYYNSSDVPWINSSELNEPFIVSTENFISYLGLSESSAKIYPANTVLVAMYGATAGKVSYLSFDAASNQAVCGVIPNDTIDTEFIYFALSSLCDHYISISSGSARDNISQAVIRDTVLLSPPIQMLQTFHSSVFPLFNRIVECKNEIETLTALREELLPLLMNGQVSVKPTAVNCDLALLKNIDKLHCHNTRLCSSRVIINHKGKKIQTISHWLLSMICY